MISWVRSVIKRILPFFFYCALFLAKSKAEHVIQQKGAEKVYKNIQLIDTQDFNYKAGIEKLSWITSLFVYLCLYS